MLRIASGLQSFILASSQHHSYGDSIVGTMSIFNKLFLLSFVTVVSVVLLVSPGIVLAQTTPATTAEPQNVLDYYLLLPEAELPVVEHTKKSRKELIKAQDLANGYLVLGTDELQGITQIVLFRKKDHGALIGVALTEQTVASNGSVKFMQYTDGRWTDATAKVLPKIADKEILAAYNRIKKRQDEARTLQDMPAVYWELPRKGTTVELRCGEDSDSKDKVLLRFAWDGIHLTKEK